MAGCTINTRKNTSRVFLQALKTRGKSEQAEIKINNCTNEPQFGMKTAKEPTFHKNEIFDSLVKIYFPDIL